MSDEVDFKELINHKYFWPGLLALIYLIIHVPMINIYKTLWWDEAQYALMTKNFFKGTPTTGWWDGRSIVYPGMMYFLTLPIGYNELAIKFINILLGAGFIITSYYLVKELIGKKYAIIAGLIMNTHWVFLYWSLRITIDVPSAFLLTLSALLFIKSEKDYRLNLASGVLLGLAFNIRFTAAITGLIYLVYNLLQKKKLKDYYWLIGILIGMAPLAIYDLAVFGNPLHSTWSFMKFNLETTGGSQQGDQLYYISTMIMNYGILMGITLFIGFIPLAFKIKKSNIQFIGVNIITYLLAYSLLTQVKEVRFLIHLLPFMIITALLGMSISLNTLFRSKKATTIGLTILTIIVILENLPIGLASVQKVSDSYNDVRLAGEFLKEYPGERIMCNSVPQMTYYSEKEVFAFPQNETGFYEQFTNYSYVIISSYESHPDYAMGLNDSLLVPIKAYPEPQNARLIILLVNNTN